MPHKIPESYWCVSTTDGALIHLSDYYKNLLDTHVKEQRGVEHQEAWSGYDLHGAETEIYPSVLGTCWKSTPEARDSMRALRKRDSYEPEDDDSETPWK